MLAQDAGNDLAQRAEAAGRARHYDDAASLYRQMLQAQPQSGELWSNLGAMQAMGGHCPEAQTALGRARSLNPGLFAPWYFGGFCELQFHHDERALADLERALKINPKDANAWFLKAQAAGNLGRMAEAFQATTRGLAQNPDEPEGYYRAGKFALDLAARQYAQITSAPRDTVYPHLLEGERDAGQGLWDMAIGSYQKAAALAPRDPTVQFVLATANLGAGKLADAERELRECLELFPASQREGSSTAWIRARLALVLAQEDERDEAERIIASLEPEQFHAPEEFEDYVAAASRLGQPERATRALQLALARFPDDAELAGLKNEGGDRSSASGSDTKPANPGSGRVGLAVRFLAICNPPEPNALASALSPGQAYRDFTAAFSRGDALATASFLAGAVERAPASPAQAFALGELLQWVSYQLYRRLLTRFPESDAAQRLSAENLEAAGESDQALQIYQSLLERRGPSPELLRAVAEIHWTEHNWDEALKVLKSINEMDPYDATTLVNMGRIYTYRQDLERAESCFTRAARLDPGMFEAHLGLGEALRRRGDDAGALRELKIAAQIAPENPRPHYSLAQIYRKSEEKELAAQEMQTFQRLQVRAVAEKPQLVPLD